MPTTATWTEQVDHVHARIASRIRELEPLEAELAELRILADRLGVAPAATPAKARTRSRVTTGARKRKARARPGGRRQQVLDMVRATPGITIPEIGQALGVDSTGLYRVERSLRADGLITKDGRHLRPTPRAVTPNPAESTPEAA